MSDFHTQGPVPLDSDAYIEREFEQSVYNELTRGNWVLLLGPRQHGKSTGIARIKKRFEQDEIICANVDLQAKPHFGEYSDLLEWFAVRVARQLDLDRPQRPDENGSLTKWLERSVPVGKGPVVIIVDEASNIRDENWRNNFFGQLRSISTKRVDANPTDLAKRVRFVFSGCFKPETLIDELNSPFNVCTRIETEDLSLSDAQELLASGDDTISAEYAERAYEMVGGQPYLLQYIFSRLKVAEAANRDEVIEEVIEQLRSGKDHHFEGLFSKVFGDSALADLVSAMVQEGYIPNYPADPDCKYLQVLGLAKREEGRLTFRNSMYQEFATRSPQLNEDPDREKSPTTLIPPVDRLYDCIDQVELREITISATRGAIRAYNAGSYRLAVIGFGSALEAILIDWLSSLDKKELKTAVQSANPNFNHYEADDDPLTYRLVNLIKVARETPNPVDCVDPPDALRHWRNQVHPAVILKDYMPENELEPEARQASGMVQALLRDVDRSKGENAGASV